MKIISERPVAGFELGNQGSHELTDFEHGWNVQILMETPDKHGAYSNNEDLKKLCLQIFEYGVLMNLCSDFDGKNDRVECTDGGW